MKNFVASEPVITFLNGLAVTVNLILIALVANGVLSMDGDQILKTVAAIQGSANLIAATIRPFVTPNAKVPN